jgi:glutamate N-acetyltransferase/amino-acid N-acetyltransferase
VTPGPGVSRTTLPQGFYTGGINSGVRRYRPDLGVIVSERPAVAAGVFTLNQCKAAPVLRAMKLLPASGVRAIVTNSGQANAATGEQGIRDDQTMADAVAAGLGCDATQVLTASTGVIGAALDIEKISKAVPELLRRKSVTAEPFALSILTTDLVPKSVVTDVVLSGGTVRLTGICKGSGMIHPNMGTMLGYFLTDAELSQDLAASLLREVNEVSFNMISVDGESSTNDCAFLMANGASGVGIKDGADLEAFRKALREVAIFLAQSIARDGEGATKLIQVELVGSPSLELARKAARGLVMSPLVKTAIYGEDPNWGRILARLGADQVPIECLNRMVLSIQDLPIFENGAPLRIDLERLSSSLALDTVRIHIDLRSGTELATAWGCDLTEKYVQINAEYTT